MFAMLLVVFSLMCTLELTQIGRLVAIDGILTGGRAANSTWTVVVIMVIVVVVMPLFIPPENDNHQ